MRELLGTSPGSSESSTRSKAKQGDIDCSGHRLRLKRELDEGPCGSLGERSSSKDPGPGTQGERAEKGGPHHPP